MIRHCVGLWPERWYCALTRIPSPSLLEAPTPSRRELCSRTNLCSTLVARRNSLHAWTRRRSSTGVPSVFSGYTRALCDYKPSIFIFSALHKLLASNQWIQWEWTECLGDIWSVALIWQVVTVLVAMARWRHSSSLLSLAARGDTPSGKLIVLVAQLIYWWSAPSRDNEFMGCWLMSEWSV